MVNPKNKESGYLNLNCKANKKSLDCTYYHHLRCIEISEPMVEMDKPCINVRKNGYGNNGQTEQCINYILWWKEYGYE